ncbi:hypothetical protein INR49_017614, partial [Caranx melampygus]
MPLECRPLCSDIRPEESEECRAPGRSPPRLMVFQGPQRAEREEERDHSERVTTLEDLWTNRGRKTRGEKNKGFEKRLTMVCLCWLLVVVMAYVCVPGFGSVCWNSSICNDLSNNKGRILSDLQAHSDQRRSYLMEHFRWGKPRGDKILVPKLGDHSNKRRSYSMEHFRWGKPSGRKRRPIKVFASSLEGGASSEGSFRPQARRQLNTDEDGGKADLNQESHQYQELLSARVSSKSHVLLSPQDRKDGTYRMSHFRWGNPPASKRN